MTTFLFFGGVFLIGKRGIGFVPNGIGFVPNGIGFVPNGIVFAPSLCWPRCRDRQKTNR